MMTSINQLMDNNMLKTELVTALQTLLFTQTFLEMIRPHHEALCEEALERFKPVVENRPSYKGSRRLQATINRPITDYFNLYQASEKQAHAIYAWHKVEMAKRGFVADGEGRCPFRIAEINKLEAERQLIDEMAPYTDIASQSIWNMKMRGELLEKLQGLLMLIADEQSIDLNILADTDS